MEASIGVSAETKRRLARLKMPDVTWDELLHALTMSCDEETLQEELLAVHQTAEAQAVDRAKVRYLRYRSDPAALLTADELKQRIRMRRVADRFDEIARRLREGTHDHSLLAALSDTDAELHRLSEELAKGPA